MAILLPLLEGGGAQRVPNPPKQSQYVLPAESVPHSHTVMGFPTDASSLSEEWGDGLRTEVARIANAIAKFEPVHLFARPEWVDKAKAMVGPNVTVKVATLDELWVRDSGPIFVYDRVNKRRAAVDFNFSYWGHKMEFTGDQEVAAQVAKHADAPCVKSKINIEGGAVEHDGNGTFMATESCIINDNRNPEMAKEEIEAELGAMFGVTNFIWLPGIRDWDITDFHIDAFARFTEPGVVLLSKPGPNGHQDVHKAYAEARAILAKATDAEGRSLTVHDCEEPDPTKIGPPDHKNETVASYANYLLVNGGVILPKFGQETDQRALELFQKLFPTRKVEQVLINKLPRTGGGIHCSTQHVPDV